MYAAPVVAVVVDGFVLSFHDGWLGDGKLNALHFL